MNSIVKRLESALVPASEWLAGIDSDTAKIEPPALDGRPAVVLPGDGKALSTFCRELGLALASKEIFRRDGIVLYVTEGHKLEPMPSKKFVTWAEQFVRVEKWAGSGKERRLEEASMTEASASMILESDQFLRELHPIRRVNLVRQPVIRKDGRLELLPVGYDAESETVTVGEVEFDEKMDLYEAITIIEDLQREFAWPKEDAQKSRSIALAAMLAVFGDMMIPPSHMRPVFIYTANREGAGKTLQVRVAVCPTFGPAVIGPPPDPGRSDALTKLLASAALGGAPYLIFDNWTGRIGNASLEAFTTSSTYSDRVLGVSKMFTVQKSCLVFITGNNAIVSPDMRRRSLVVNLEVLESRAEDRKIEKPLGEPEILAMRPKIVSALWAIIRSWNEAGRPVGSVKHGSFPAWSALFGGIIDNLGLENPCGMTKLVVDDTLRDFQQLVTQAYETALNPDAGVTFTFPELMAFSRERGFFEWVLADEPPEDASGKKSERSSFGKILGRFEGSQFGELEFVKGEDLRDKESRTRTRTFIIRRRGHGQS